MLAGATLAGARAGAEPRKEFDLLAELVRNAGKVVTREDLMARVWDVNWFGSTKTLDVHIGWLRRKLGDDADDPRLDRDPAWRRVPLRRAGGGAVSLRATLLLALAYVVLLALIALGVPLAISLRDRVDSEVRAQARSQADVVAVTAEEVLDESRPRGWKARRRERRHRARAGDRGRRQGPGARGQRRSGAARSRLLEPSGDRRGAARPIRADHARRARRSAARSSPPPSRWFTTATPSARSGSRRAPRR